MPRTIAERTRRVYDMVASVYPVSTFFFHSKAHACALRHSGIRNGMRVLEVATGSGEMFRRLVKANPDGRTFGLDLSPNMAAHTLRVARKACPQAQAHCGAVDVRSLPFRTASFDAVMCCYLLELLSQDDIQLTLREIRRVLRAGGKFSLVVIGQNVKMFNHLYTVGGKLVPAFWGRQVESGVPELIREAGMRVVTDRFVRQGFYPSRVLVAENSVTHGRTKRHGR
ncbi:MAG: Methyltransferase type 11 [Bryobacterales bacterium]|jgi:ubiquinone/menaquinone biosynthesis C-methylase UbiE|nr:Methyltransferase type 11 [Bryobacterales bacterium]